MNCWVVIVGYRDCNCGRWSRGSSIEKLRLETGTYNLNATWNYPEPSWKILNVAGTLFTRSLRGYQRISNNEACQIGRDGVTHQLDGVGRFDENDLFIKVNGGVPGEVGDVDVGLIEVGV